MPPWQQAAFASQALLIGTWTNSTKGSVRIVISKQGGRYIRTGDQDGDVERCALDTKVATTENGTEETSVRSIAHLLDLVAAIELCITASLNTLFNGIVTADFRFVGGTVPTILAIVTHLLISSAVITG